MADPNKTVDQNLLPVQAYFAVDGTFQTFIGQGQPFTVPISGPQSGLQITNSTLESSPIGATAPSTGVFTNISTTTGTISTTAVNNTDIANKYYVDTVAQGLAPKAACQVATTANITLSGLQTIDTYTTLAGDRVLVKNQGTSSQNGIYIASASAWTRSTDMDVWSEVSGAYTVILSGSANVNTGWVCTASASGTIGVTAMPWVQFSSQATYTAGTGLTLASNTFSITNTGVTAASYGSASKTLTATVNAQGQLTSLSASDIAIANTQVSGLGTMSTQNASSVAITGGAIDGTTIGATTATTVRGTTITATTQFSGAGTGLTGTAAGLSIGGNASTATTASATTASATFNNGGSGGTSGSTFNGGTALTVSYNTIGAPSTTGTNATGTWGIGISGNAATVTNGLYSTGSYSNPTWLTSISGSIVSGAVTSATTATNIAGGTAGALAYNSASGTTTFLGLGTTNYVLTAGASAPQYVAQSTLSVGSATSATTATNLAGGGAGYVPYQTGSGATAFVSAGTTGQVLTSNGTSTPTWSTPTSYATVTDDTTTNATRYPLFASATSGTLSTEYTSSTKYQFNPSTGILTATGFSGSGASLTALNASNISTGTLSIAYGGTGLGTTPTNGQLLIGNGTNYTLSTLTAGSNVTITNTSGGISIAAVSGAVTLSDDTTTNATRYPLFANATSGTVSTEYTSSTKLQYNPSSGELASPELNATNGIYVQANTVSSSYTIPSASTGVSYSPITIASGASVTISASSTWRLI